MVPPIAPPAVTDPRVEEAKSLFAEIDSLPVESSVAVRLLACNWAFNWSSVLTVPPVPAPKVTLTAVPALKEEKVKVLPLMPPTPAARAAVKLLLLLVGPLRPRADSALPVPPLMLRSVTVPVLSFSVPFAFTDDGVTPVAVENAATPAVLVAVCTPEARSIAFPLPSVWTPLRMPEPVGTCAAAGTCALEKVMVWPSTFRVEPSWIRLAVVSQRWYALRLRLRCRNRPTWSERGPLTDRPCR